jgi:A/G-specific adenine glycosylase
MNKISDILIAWYQKNKRDLPWRRNTNAYYIWVSEIMLQQTRVEAVKPYFERFISALPTITDLALVEDDALMKLWEGLGYYSRVRNMKKAAIVCLEKYDSKLPTTYEQLLELPGIGPYTAGAIASIAFKEPACAIDGNVLRVYARLFAIEKDILQESTKKEIKAIMEQDLAEDMGEMNQALMDFGSSICIGNGNPRCNICPLIKKCLAYQDGKIHLLPIRRKQKQRRKEKYTIAIYTFEDEVLIHKRKDQGLLAGVYEFMTLDNHYAKKDFPKAKYLGKYKHVFSHIEWDMKGFVIPVKEKFIKDDFIWVKVSDLEKYYTIPGAFQPYKEKAFS